MFTYQRELQPQAANGFTKPKGMLSGNVKRYKGKLEANDLTQKRGIDYHSMSSLFCIRAASKGSKKQFFLIEDLKEEVYI